MTDDPDSSVMEMSGERGALAVAPSAAQPRTAVCEVRVVAERCAGCEECVVRCPAGALSIDPQRWIAQADDSLCVGCRQCERTCPFAAIRVTGPRLCAPRRPVLAEQPAQLLGDTEEAHRGLPNWEAAIAEAERCLLCPDPTCMEGCPAHNDIPGFIEQLRAYNVRGAQAVLAKTSVLPDVCSRVCDTAVQCEGACSWALAGGEAVAIGLLERFVADQFAIDGVQRTSNAGEGFSVGVVGSGPAGVAAAWELLAAGAEVTMLEKDAQAGGVPRWGIPAFTLPDEVAERPIEALRAAGLKLKTSCALGHHVSLDDLLAEHDAVILAHGASQPLVPPIPGRELRGVEDATDFLTRAKEALACGEELADVGPGRHVLVLGGGNTAMDAARTVRRLGGQATCVEWMDERFGRVRPDELVQARREGVEIRFTTTVERLEGDDGSVRAAYLRRTRQRRVDEQPRILPGTAERLAVDHVVFALGYRVRRPPSTEQIEFPLPPGEQRDALLDRRWLASGIMAGRPAEENGHGPRSQVGWLALEREVGLAVSSSPFATGWWTRLLERRAHKPAGSSRTNWWVWRWRRRAVSGLATAPEPRAERVWVAGDALVGPSTVAGAMAQGRAAARAVLKTCGARLPEPATTRLPER